MTLTQFYCKAGALLRYTTLVEGESPQRRFIAHWQYEHGHARYDGHNWELHLS